MKKWVLRGCKVSAEQISATAKKMGISVSAARLLAVRGLIEPEDIEDYFASTLHLLHLPGELKDLNKGCDILWQGIKDGQKIAVFGDYDADGITSTSIMTLVLRRLGGDVRYYIPRRDTEGYGLNSSAVEKLAAEGVKILLTLDNGIAAFEQVQLAKDLGMTVIIADHHEVPFDIIDTGSVYKVPAADAVIDPKQRDCPYPFKSICAGMLAYKLAERMYELAGRDWQSEHLEYLIFAAIATVCDIMDLTDENRELVKYALEHIAESPNLGLRALLEVNSLQPQSLSSYHIGFAIGPCINASGRLENAAQAVELFLTEDYDRAMELARHLFELNIYRKDLSSEGVEKIRAEIDANGYAQNKVIVVHQPQLPESVAGIVAGRIKEIYNRPTFVLAGDKEQVKGSGRSVEGFNMFKALVECADLLDMYGGHFMATGLTIPAANIDELRRRLNENCKMETDDMLPVIYIDMSLPVERALSGMGFAQFIANMAPFGHGNAAPLFGDRDLQVKRIQLMGADKQIIRFFFADRIRQGLCSAISFRKKDEFEQIVRGQGGEEMWQRLLKGQPVNLSLDIVYSIEINEFKGSRNVQLQIKDLRLHQNQ
ncbi:MAG: single-stranded-DNA-specific exonuclease RecJ [Firmicutes bacterium]|nr:single-stranded-DNA-specific exonuclease RecJ [Bacillota bacterium]